MSSNSTWFATEINAPFETLWPLIDFAGPGWEIEGDPRSPGAVRTCVHPQAGKLVDRLEAYQHGADQRSFTYAILNEDNAFGARGYLGTITLLRNTRDPGRSFFTYQGRWEQMAAPVEALQQMLSGAVAEWEAAARAG